MSNEIQILWPKTGLIISTHKGNSYTIDNLIGVGNFGIVHKAHDLFDYNFAIKTILPRNRDFNDVFTGWTKEVDIQKKLNHPNIVRIYDWFVHENLFYLVMEKADYTLSQVIDYVGPLNDRFVWETAHQLLAGLNCIHTSGYIQRDLHPGNILVFQDKNGFSVKISDFGISQEISQSEDQKFYDYIINPYCRPPEHVIGGYTNKQSDLYQLGLVLLSCKLGKSSIFKGYDPDKITQFTLDGLPMEAAKRLKSPLGDFVSILLSGETNRFKNVHEAWRCLKEIKC